MFGNKKNNLFNAYGVRRRGDGFIGVVLIILIVLLPVMAYFQYKWLSQLSEAETVRTRSNLKISADRFSEDFDRQLTQIYQNFQIEDRPDNQQDLITYLFSRYQQIAQSAGPDSLIEEIYLLTLNPGKRPKLLRLDTETDAAAESEWPAALSFIRAAIQPEDADNILRLLQVTQTPWLEKKTIIITSNSPSMIFDSRKMENFHLVMVILNQKYLTKKLIPALLKTHFGGFEDHEFDLAIARKGGPDSLYYASEPELTAADFSDADVTADLGRWRMRGVFIATAVTEKANVDIRKFARGINRTEISLKVISRDSVDNKEFSRYLINEVPGWELRVRHRSGSLEAAIRATHLRNLLIGNGILAFLGISIIMVFVSSRRARKLAAQQLEFVAGVSHELRTPLSVIRSAAENLADGVIRDPEQTHRYGSLIRDEGRRLTELVEQVLVFGGIQNGNRPLSKQAVDLNVLIGEILRNFEQDFLTSKASVETDFDAGLPDIECDRNGIIIVLKNIISNALKYSGENVIIKISSAFDASDNSIHIRICDQGIGIGADEIKRIFEPFFRSRTVINEQISGTGLGLSLAQKIILLHNGNIVVTSRPKTGSCFEIILPARDKAG